MTTSSDAIFATLCSIFEEALGLPTNFFLQQNIPSTGTGAGPFGRVWIEDDSATNNATTITTTNAIGGGVDQSYEVPLTFRVTVHFYRAGASDLARKLTYVLWDATPIERLRVANMALGSIDGKQNVAGVINETWEAHTIVTLTFHMIDSEVISRPALDLPPDITTTLQTSGGWQTVTTTGSP